MILRRELSGIYIIEFENPSGKWFMDAADVLDLIPGKDKEKENRFSLVYLVILIKIIYSFFIKSALG